MLYNTCHVRYKIYIIENKICYVMLYNICHVVISNVLCYVI